MKLQQLHEDAVALQEGLFQRAVAAAAVAVSALTAGHFMTDKPQNNVATGQVVDQLASQKGISPAKMAQIVDQVSQRYKVDRDTVEEIVRAAFKHERADFPKAKDLLAVIGVESSFNPNAKSALKRDPAVGLTQVRPGVWNLPKGALSTIDGQVKAGADILHQYYKKLGDREAALHAYNVGLTNHMRSLKKPSKGNPRYVPKVNAELDKYAQHDKPNDLKNRPVTRP